MYMYYILVLLPMLICAIRRKTNVIWKGKIIKNVMQNKEKIAISVFFLLFLFMLVFRSENIGRDLDNYHNLFLRISDLSWGSVFTQSTEIGYVLYSKLFTLFSTNFQLFLAVTAIITMIPLWYLYKSEIVDVSLTISLFVFMPTFAMAFSGLRQSIAISIGTVCYIFAKKRKLIPFIITLIIAISFHTSAFMLVFMYPLYCFKITKKNILFFVPVFIVLLVFNKQIFTMLMPLISDYYSVKITSTGAINSLLLFVMFGIVCYVLPDEKLLDEETVGMRNFLLLVIVVQFFASLNPWAMRMGYYYLIFIPLLMPKILQASTKWRQVAVLAKIVLIVYFLYNFFILVPKENALDTFPYQFFWETGI